VRKCAIFTKLKKKGLCHRFLIGHLHSKFATAGNVKVENEATLERLKPQAATGIAGKSQSPVTCPKLMVHLDKDFKIKNTVYEVSLILSLNL
jgi:hypothetical protein